MSKKIANKMEKKLVVLRLGAAHGLRGEIKATAFTEDPLVLKKYGALFGPNDAQFRVKSIKQNAKGIIISLQDIITREQAEALNGTELSVLRSALPDVDNDDDFYYADLIGLSAVNLTGETIGAVLAVHDFGAGDILELRLINQKQVMIPFSKLAVPKVDMNAGHVTIDEDAAGLNDNSGPDDQDQNVL